MDSWEESPEQRVLQPVPATGIGAIAAPSNPGHRAPHRLFGQFLIKNNSIVSIFAQPVGTGSAFNKSSLAEERRKAWLAPGPGSHMRDFLSTVTSPIL